MTGAVESIRELVAAVPDPEIPVLTIGDLGIIAGVRVDEGGAVEVDITPTYSGCPALEVIRADVEDALRRHGHTAVTVRTVLTPAWTTDRMSEAGRRKLREHGIAPPPPVPACAAARPPVSLQLLALPVRCPRCGSTETEELSRFGSTACKALYRCSACREPFEHFKAH